MKQFGLRPNYLFFIGYLKTGGRGGGAERGDSSEPPPPEPALDPPLSLISFTIYRRTEFFKSIPTLISHPTYVVGTQKNRLNKAVPLSTQTHV